MGRRIREVKVVDIILYFALSLVIFALLITAAVIACIKLDAVHNAIIISACVILSYYPVKRLAIGCVLLYKAFAPMSVRERCRFEPCCSTYMIMAIQKYGLFIGIFRGIRRIVRCRPPNGGTDMP